MSIIYTYNSNINVLLPITVAYLITKSAYFINEKYPFFSHIKWSYLFFVLCKAYKWYILFNNKRSFQEGGPYCLELL